MAQGRCQSEADAMVVFRDAGFSVRQPQRHDDAVCRFLIVQHRTPAGRAPYERYPVLPTGRHVDFFLHVLGVAQRQRR